LPARVDTPREAAHVLLAQRALHLGAGVVLSNPVSDGLDAADFARWLAQAREDLRASGIRGRDTTPYLLARLAELSGGATLEINLRLLEENARLAAAVAVELSGMEASRPAAAPPAASVGPSGGSA
jgi:pseudouridine-5'-phosphate glycosidase